MNKIKVYLAGPDVFKCNARNYLGAIKDLGKKLGIEFLVPLDNEITSNDPEDTSREIYNGNIDMIKNCDLILVNLDRFRGPSIDSGTAFELGYALALGKKAIGYNYDGKEYKDVVIDKYVSSKYPIIEEFGLYDNLMIVHSISARFETLIEAINAVKLI